ncbi:MAG: hypothetical protein FJ104_02585 [Deltaproteobacteria bacterium]|nr:hypothetical protein [Deltaproteobacteria bacterium]
MSEEETHGTEGDETPDDEAVRRLLRGAFPDPTRRPEGDVLRGFQARVRERSGGKFYADLWSTSAQPPVVVFLGTAALLLALVGAAWAVLAPLRGQVERVPMAPRPVEVLPPQR